MGKPNHILYCNCSHADVVPSAVKREVLERLSSSGVAFDAVVDLCEMAARKDSALQRFVGSGTLTVAACYPRAVRWLFHAGGAPLPDDGVEVLNMRERSADEVVCRLLPREGSSEERKA